MTRKRLALGAGVLLFLAASVIVARWLAVEGAERARVERVLEAQARGDAGAMAEEISGKCECSPLIDDLARTLRGPGDVEIVRYDSATSHALKTETGWTRVVWRRGDGLPQVQCFRVQRKGHALRPARVTLLALRSPIGLQQSC